MSRPDLLIVEFLRESGEIKKQLVSSSGLTRMPGPTAGEYAALTVMGMVAEAKELRPGDRLSVRIPIEGIDIPGDDEDAIGRV
jgi:hypothetical protein